MKMNHEIYEIMKQNNNMITTSQVVSMGYTRALLTKYVKEGLLERCRQGLYILTDTVHDDMYTLMLRSENIIFSHDTALFLNKLSERTPFSHSITIPSNSVLPKSLRGECICYYVKPELHGMGIIQVKTTFGNTVRCYDLERTLCDIMRSRNRLDEETVIDALKKYSQFRDKDLNRLAAYAQRLNVSTNLRRYMEVLL